MANYGRLKQPVYELLVQQAKNELRNANVYSTMGNNMSVKGFEKSGEYLLNQSKEEREHFEKIWEYITSRNATANIEETVGSGVIYDSLLQVYSDAMDLEFGTTDEWTEIYKVANDNLDFITVNLAKEFMGIQKAEEEEIMNINDQLKLIGDNPTFLLLWDNNH